MTKLQLFGYRIRTEKKKSGSEVQVLETILKEKEEKCKQCNVEPRAVASRNCEKCKTKHKVKLHGEKKLENRRQQFEKSGKM